LHRAGTSLWLDYGDLLRTDGASKPRVILERFVIGRGEFLTAFLAAFGRAIAEVGAIIMVGGNIRGYTRTMTTTSALETSKEDLALALGLILILLSVTVTAFLLAGWSTRGRRYPRAHASQNGRYRKQKACGPVEVGA
jgi:tungstate transport system permease protein